MRNFSKGAGTPPTEPTKPGSAGFVGFQKGSVPYFSAGRNDRQKTQPRLHQNTIPPPTKPTSPGGKAARSIKGEFLDPIETWSAIAQYISVRTSLDVSQDAAQRWARQTEDPLPVRRFGRRRPRVVANPAAINAWCDRQWRDISASPSATPGKSDV